MDGWITDVVTDHRPEWVVSVAKAVTSLGGTWQALGLVALVLLAARRVPVARRAAIGAGAWVATALLVDAMKSLFDRARPPAQLAAIHVSDAAMPSAHCARMALVVTVAWLLWRRRWVGALATLLVVAMAWSRVTLGVHWFSDTVVGIAVGTVIAFVAVRVACPALAGRTQGGD